jgi:hypothetical protein
VDVEEIEAVTGKEIEAAIAAAFVEAPLEVSEEDRREAHGADLAAVSTPADSSADSTEMATASWILMSNKAPRNS